MRDIARVLRLHLLQPRLQARMRAEERRAAGAQLVQHLEDVGDRLIGAALVRLGELAHQQPDRLHSGPTGRRRCS